MTELFTKNERGAIGGAIGRIAEEQRTIAKIEDASTNAQRVLVAMFLASRQRAHQQAFADEALALLDGMSARSFAGYVSHLTAIGCVADSFRSRTGQMYALKTCVISAIEDALSSMPTADTTPAASPYQDLFGPHLAALTD